MFVIYKVIKEVEMKRKDLTGQRFGHLTVIEMLYRYKGSRRTYCRCLCDCGNEHIIESSHLQKRKNVSCGCMTSYYRAINNRTNEIGNRYGRLTIIDIDHSTRPSMAICECGCGKTIRAIKTDVVRCHTQSCGCLHSEITSQSNEKDFTDVISDAGVVIKKRAYKNSYGTWMWYCDCPICGKEFIALPAKVMENHTTSCGCKLNSSKERIIENYLKELSLNYEKQKRFEDCKYYYTLPFDFAIYNNDGTLICLIEYDGQQHFKPIDFFGGIDGFEKTKIRDSIKNQYCKNNNIRLLRLNYLNTDNEIKKMITNIIYP